MDAPGREAADSSPPPFGGHVRFEKVGFSYHPGQAALNAVSFDVAPGQKIALVGPSGAGKSTIFNLLLRFYDVEAGRIAIDGQDIRTVTISIAARQSCALVTQDSFQFDDTVTANIGYGRDGATGYEIIEAAKSAAAHEFISQLPQGL